MTSLLLPPQVEEPESAAVVQMPGTAGPVRSGEACGIWIGAHPLLGEQLADALLQGALADGLPGGRITAIKRQASKVAGTDMRADFQLAHEDGSQTLLEVKTVVDSDYDPNVHVAAAASLIKQESSEQKPKKQKKAKGKVMYFGPTTDGGGYQRAAIFPWGGGKQKGPRGEPVVSARAIKHLRELTAVARGQKVLPLAVGDPSTMSAIEETAGTDGRASKATAPMLRAAVLFVVVRHDVTHFRPNTEACPTFASHLKEAHESGVTLLARRIRWGEGGQVGKAFDDGDLPIRIWGF